MSLRLRPLSHRSRKPEPRKRDRRPQCPLLQHRRVDPHAELHVWRLDAKRSVTERATHPNGDPVILPIDATVADVAQAIDHLGPGLYRVVARAARVSGRQDYEARHPWSAPSFTRRRPSDAERLRAKVDAERAARKQAEAERDMAHDIAAGLQADVEHLRRELAERDAQLATLEKALTDTQVWQLRARALYAGFSARSPEPEPTDGGTSDLDVWTERACTIVERLYRLDARQDEDGP